MGTEQYQFYKNAQYRNTRNEKKTLVIAILDSTDQLNLGRSGEFDFKLFEPLKIDKHSEVYLDNFISINSNTTALGLNNCGFCLNINEFNINSGAASNLDSIKNTLNSSIFIPNEHSTLADNHTCILHKSKKFNYVCDINPCKLGRISGKITNMVGDTVFHGADTDHLNTNTLVNITAPGESSSSTDFPRAGQPFTDLSINKKGKLEGNSFTGYNFATLGSENLIITVDGTTLAAITLNADMSTITQAATELTSAIAGASVIVEGEKLVILSDSLGTTSSIQIEDNSQDNVKALFANGGDVSGLVTSDGSPFPAGTGLFLSNVSPTSTVIHFTTGSLIKGSDKPFDDNGKANIEVGNMVFTMSDGSTFTINLTYGTSDIATLVHAHGGFVAEFLIISKE